MLFLPLATKAQGLRLEDCQKLAQENYPLIKKYDLIEKTTDYTISNLNKGNLPKIIINAQASYQSDVMTLPGILKNMLASNGSNVKGLKKDQYKLSLEVNQNIYDGGNIRAGKELTISEGEVKRQQNGVDMYAMRDRINNLFFGILLVDNQLRLNEELQTLLSDNCRKIKAMIAAGTAMPSDVDAVQAQYLSTMQQHIKLESSQESYRRILSIFIGKEINSPLVKPDTLMPASMEVMRPELQLFNAQSNLVEAQRKMLNATLRPTISIYAQGYYGYPGYDMFNDMFNHDWSINGIIGVRLSWNISKLYTHKNDRRKLEVACSEIENAKDVFLFNNSIQTSEERTRIEHYRKIMQEDDKIINLRTSVRKAAEAKLKHGIFDVNNLLQEITHENYSRMEKATHEIELLKNIYELKNTLNQ